MRRSSCNRSLASFFRYSSEARSGSSDFDIGHLPPMICPASASFGLEVSVSNRVLEEYRVGSTLYADRGPPFGLAWILSQPAICLVGPVSGGPAFGLGCVRLEVPQRDGIRGLVTRAHTVANQGPLLPGFIT